MHDCVGCKEGCEGVVLRDEREEAVDLVHGVTVGCPAMAAIPNGPIWSRSVTDRGCAR
jgi:hypothetical protein